MGRYALTALLASVVLALAIITGGATGATQDARPAPADQFDPAIAFNGTDYLVSWTDVQPLSRWRTFAGPPPTPPPPPPPGPPGPPPPPPHIVGSRVHPDGKVLDPGGIAIRTAGVAAGSAAASDGTNSLVVWTDRRADGGDVYGARITPTGRVLDQAGIPISVAGGVQVNPRVGFDGTNYLVVWEDTRTGQSEIYGARVAPDGTVLDPQGILVSPGFGSSYEPSIAFDGVNYLVAWTRLYSGVYVARVKPSGGILDPAGVQVSGSWSSGSAVAFDGTNYLVAWTDHRAYPGATGKIYAARVSRTAEVLDPSGIQLSTGPRDDGQSTVAFDGANYLVAWADGRAGCCSIYGTLVRPDGTVRDPDGIGIATHGNEQVSPSVAFDGMNYFVAWTDRRSGAFDVYGARVNRDGQVLDSRGILLSTALPPAAAPPAARCVVPRLVGLRLASAKRRIRRAHCSVGAIRWKRSRLGGMVLAQRPRARAIRRARSPVRLVVGRRARW